MHTGGGAQSPGILAEGEGERGRSVCKEFDAMVPAEACQKKINFFLKNIFKKFLKFC